MSFRWLDHQPVIPNARRSFGPVSALRKVSTYVEIPSFNLPVDWLGASFIRVQFQYQASGPFLFPALPVRPANANFCLCVRYLEGSTVVRYKLWEDVGELLYVDMYNYQKIGANFWFEVWSTDGETDVNLDAAISVITGLRRNPIGGNLNPVLETGAITELHLWGILAGWNPSLGQSLNFNSLYGS